MKHNSSASVNNLPPLRRFMLALQLDPAKAVIFYSVVGILLFVTLFGGTLVLWFRSEASQAADIETAPRQTGTATVEVINYRTTKGPAPFADAKVGLRINGRPAIISVPNDERTAKLRVSDRLRVNYKVGRSDDIYIDEWPEARR